MALQLWLPLDGTLRQQGLKPVAITSQGISTATTGIFTHNCASFVSGQNSQIWARPAPITDALGEWSISFWVRYASNNGTSTLYCSRSSVGADGLVCFCGPNSGHFDDGVRHSFSWDPACTLNTWYHIVFTHGPHGKLIYRNTIKEHDFGSISSSCPRFQSIAATIGDSQQNTSYAGGNPFYGNLQDFRVYDHELSQTEINELYQGLFLHYQFNCNLQNNEATDINNINTWTVDGTSKSTDDGAIKLVNNVSGSQRAYYSFGHSGTTVKVSALMKASSNNVRFCFESSNTNYPTNRQQAFTTDWDYYEFIFKMQSTISGQFQSANSGEAIWFKNLHVQYDLSPVDCHHVYDVSGWNNNPTTLNGILQPTEENAPRYQKAFFFPQTWLNMNDFAAEYSERSEYTFSFWYKSNNTIPVGIVSAMSPSRACMTWRGTNSFYWRDSSTGLTGSVQSKTLTQTTADTWHHYAVTYKNKVMTFYIDGQAKDTYTTPGAATCTNIPIMRINNDCGTTQDSYISDFRYYIHALSADDILKLYNTSMSIDASGNVSARILTN